MKRILIYTGLLITIGTMQAADNFFSLCLNFTSSISNPPLSSGIDKMKVPIYKTVGSNKYIIMTEHENPGYVLTFDVTNPENPSRLSGNVSIDNAPNGVDVYGDFLYLSTNTGRIYAVDISDPTSLGPKHYISIASNKQLFDVAINSTVSRAYMAGTTSGNNASGLVIVNISSPSAMTYQNNIDFNAGGVRTSGNYVYITEYSGTPSLRIYDISSDPDAPSLASQLNLPGQPVSIELHPDLDIAYVGDFTSSLLHTIDISNPSSPVLLNTTHISGNQQPNFGSMKFINDMLIINSLDGLVDVYDVSTTGVPGTPLFTLDTGISNTEVAEVSPDGFYFLPNFSASPDELNIYQLCLCADLGLCINGTVTADDFIIAGQGPIS